MAWAARFVIAFVADTAKVHPIVLRIGQPRHPIAEKRPRRNVPRRNRRAGRAGRRHFEPEAIATVDLVGQDHRDTLRPRRNDDRLSWQVSGDVGVCGRRIVGDGVEIRE